MDYDFAFLNYLDKSNLFPKKPNHIDCGRLTKIQSERPLIQGPPDF